MIRRYFFPRLRALLPRLSDTEKTALRSGGVSIDRDLFGGRLETERLLSIPPVPIRSEERELWNRVDPLIQDLSKEVVLYPNPHIDRIVHRVGKDGFFGMGIHETYGGHRVSCSTQSKILTKLCSSNPSLGVLVMVPNSLGPAELLEKYGTQKQKETFLPALASGDLLPCFGLTGPHNGSDATGDIDCGTVVRGENGLPVISVTLNKRYITLAPIATLVGIAFRVEDPDLLLSKEGGKEGITLALLPRDHPGLRQESRHDPNGAGFPNGTLRGTITLSLDQVIGGPQKIGCGWEMIMDCLSVGRGISLPASANAGNKVATACILEYIRHRRQFRRPIGDMEAIQEKWVRMLFHTWVTEAGIRLTNAILDSGGRPSVLTALIKQQSTERARIVLQEAMDIYAGSAICRGPNNPFSSLYQSAPIGITVEGSNTLIRGLLLFGQGLNKSHPYLGDLVDRLQAYDEVAVGHLLGKLLWLVLHNYAYSLGHGDRSDPKSRLQVLTMKFSTLSHFVAIYGGTIKSRQILSGDMSDILCSLYLAHAVVWYHHHFFDRGQFAFMEDYCLHLLCRDAEQKVNRVIDNYDIALFRPFLRRIRYPEGMISSCAHEYRSVTELYHQVQDRHHVFWYLLTKDLFVGKGSLLERLQRLSILSPLSTEYQEVYESILQVGEWDVQSAEMPPKKEDRKAHGR